MTIETPTPTSPRKKSRIKRVLWWIAGICIGFPIFTVLALWIYFTSLPKPYNPQENWPICPKRADGADIAYFHMEKVVLGVPREIFRRASFNNNGDYAVGTGYNGLSIDGCGRPDDSLSYLEMKASIYKNTLIDAALEEGYAPPIYATSVCKNVNKCLKSLEIEMYSSVANPNYSPLEKGVRCPTINQVQKPSTKTFTTITHHPDKAVTCNCAYGYYDLEKERGLSLTCARELTFPKYGFVLVYTYRTQLVPKENIAETEQLIKKSIDQFVRDGVNPIPTPPLLEKSRY